MSDEELLGKHRGLRAELSAAYANPSWNTTHINRITQEGDSEVADRATPACGVAATSRVWPCVAA